MTLLVLVWKECDFRGVRATEPLRVLPRPLFVAAACSGLHYMVLDLLLILMVVEM